MSKGLMETYWVSPSEAKVLIYLLKNGLVYFNKINKDIFNHPYACKYTLDKLIKKGLITRIEREEKWKEDAKPVKVVYYCLTSKGVQVAELCEKLWYVLQSQ